MRVAYLGTSEFAADVMRGLAERELRPALVVTPPDRPRGRNRRLGAPPAAEAARELELPLLQTANVNEDESRAALAQARPDFGLVCAFGQILREPLLSRLELWNVHPSLLPRWRGAAPIERAIMAGDDETGVTIARVTAGLDSGPIALQEPLPIAAGDDRGTLGQKLVGLSVDLAARALEGLGDQGLATREQDEDGATYAEKIDPAERRLEPRRSATELERTVRALTPYVGAYLELEGGERLGVTSAAAEEEELSPGETSTRAGALLLGCGGGILRIETVKPAGGREMEAGDYLRGHPLPRVALS